MIVADLGKRDGIPLFKPSRGSLPIIDAHCHLDSMPDYALENGILPVTCGHTHSANMKNVSIARKLGIPFVLGISPQAAQKEGTEKLAEWSDFIRKHKPNAIGEIGLDFHWAKTEEHKQRQYAAFNSMLELAHKLKLPVVIHCRDAGDEMLQTIETAGVKNFMWHFFSGSEAQAKKAINLGFYLSIPALPSAQRKKAILLAPLEQLLVETDSPACAPAPSDVRKAVEYVASVKNLAFDEVAVQTAKNAVHLFNLRL